MSVTDVKACVRVVNVYWFSAFSRTIFFAYLYILSLYTYEQLGMTMERMLRVTFTLFNVCLESFLRVFFFVYTDYK